MAKSNQSGYIFSAEHQCHKIAQKRLRMKGRRKAVRLLRISAWTALGLRSHLQLASNAGRYSLAQGRRGFPCAHLSVPMHNTEYLSPGKDANTNLLSVKEEN